jgi:dTMP kinase
MPFGKLEILESWVQNDLNPDITFLFDVPTDVAYGRVMAMDRELDRFEREQRDFFERVRAAYLERAHQYSRRIRVIDSTKTLADISDLLEEIIASAC